ncbi:MAG: RNA polymerase subunit sigma [Oscillibacter sp.]|nr:RNA polymerase subunit sigma [Oscillibacter sp.]
MDDFLLKLEPYILKCACATTKRYISRSDDEWAISIEALYQAVQQYSYDKGNFLGFSRMMIQRRLIDYFRVQSKHRGEISVSPSAFSGEAEEEEIASVKVPISSADLRDNVLKDEIEAANAQFASYGFSFYDLIHCSPKSKKTKAACYAAVRYVAENPILANEMQRMKILPLKIIEENTRIPRKILERHRKYIIAAIEIVIGDYPGLSEYIRPDKGGACR